MMMLMTLMVIMGRRGGKDLDDDDDDDDMMIILMVIMGRSGRKDINDDDDDDDDTMIILMVIMGRSGRKDINDDDGGGWRGFIGSAGVVMVVIEGEQLQQRYFCTCTDRMSVVSVVDDEESASSVDGSQMFSDDDKYSSATFCFVCVVFLCLLYYGVTP